MITGNPRVYQYFLPEKNIMKFPNRKEDMPAFIEKYSVNYIVIHYYQLTEEGPSEIDSSETDSYKIEIIIMEPQKIELVYSTQVRSSPESIPSKVEIYQIYVPQ